jgi:hypothetical protein
MQAALESPTVQLDKAKTGEEKAEMKTNIVSSIALAGLLIMLAVSAQAAEGQKMKYLVTASEGPGFSTPEEALKVLEKGVLPTFDSLLKLEAEKRIVAGGLPVGERKFIFILEASSNEEVDQILRDIPAWGVFKWQVIPLQSFEGRAQKERSVLSELKKQLK